MSGPAGPYRRPEQRDSFWLLMIIPALFIVGTLLEGLLL